MAEFSVYDHSKKVAETIQLDDSVFQAEVNDVFLHQVLVSYKANQRQGTHQTKTRNTISGGGKKPYRQKGTGRARQGTTRAPQHRGGAAQFGPHPRSYRKTIPKKMKQEAFRQCLSLKNNRGSLFILNDLDFPEIKTKQAAGLISTFEAQGKVLFLDVSVTDKAALSVRNLADAWVLETNICSPLDLFEYDTLFVTKAAAQEFEKRYARTGGETNAA